MFAFQFECRQIVIELRRLPSIRRMTRGAFGAVSGLVRVVLQMAGGAILRRRRKVREGARVRVARYAIDLDVLAFEAEREIIVRE